MVSFVRHLAIAALFANRIMAIAIGECVPKSKSALTTSTSLPSPTLLSNTTASPGSCTPTIATVYQTTTPAAITYIFTKTVDDYVTVANVETTTVSAAPTTVTQVVNTTITVTSTITVQQYFTITDILTATAKKRADNSQPTTATTAPSSTPVSSNSAAAAACYPVTTTVYQTATPDSVIYYITDTVDLYSTITSYKTQTAPAATVAVTKQDTITTTKTRTITVQAFVTVTEMITGTAVLTGTVEQCSGNIDCPFGPGFSSTTSTKTS